MKVTLKTKTPEIETTIVEIARVSSGRKNKKGDVGKLIRYLIKNKHYSPFEHGYITLEIETSKAISIQLLRHRSFTFQEFSQRYAEVTKIESFGVRKQAKDNRQSSTEDCDNSDSLKVKMMNVSLDAIMLYYELLKKGVARECARMILPMSSQTTIYMTGNVRSWLHFLDIRDDEHSQKEMQLLAKEIKKVITKVCPLTTTEYFKK